MIFLTKSILKLMSDICKDLGIVLFSYTIVAPIISGMVNIYFSIGGILACLLLWGTSIYLTAKNDKLL